MYRKVTMGDEHPLGMERPVVELFRVSDRGREVTRMARHVRTPQVLAAMDGGRWGIWLAPPGPDPVDPIWVDVAPEEAIVLDVGTWHHGPIPLDGATGAYLTIEAPATNRDDLEQRDVRRSTDEGRATGPWSLFRPPGRNASAAHQAARRGRTPLPKEKACAADMGEGPPPPQKNSIGHR